MDRWPWVRNATQEFKESFVEIEIQVVMANININYLSDTDCDKFQYDLIQACTSGLWTLIPQHTEELPLVRAYF